MIFWKTLLQLLPIIEKGPQNLSCVSRMTKINKLGRFLENKVVQNSKYVLKPETLEETIESGPLCITDLRLAYKKKTKK